MTIKTTSIVLMAIIKYINIDMGMSKSTSTPYYCLLVELKERIGKKLLEQRREHRMKFKRSELAALYQLFDMKQFDSLPPDVMVDVLEVSTKVYDFFNK